MANIKSQELTSDASNPLMTDEFLMNTSAGTSRVPRSAIPGLANELIFVTGKDSPLTLTEADHLDRFVNVNNSVDPIVFNVPDVDDVLPNIAGSTLRFGGLFCTLVIGSGAQDVSFVSVTPGDLRGIGPDGQLIAADTIFVGKRRADADECIIRFYKRGGLWVAESLAGWRANSADNGDRLQTPVGSAGYQITDDDHNIPVWITASDAGTLSFQSDIATGTQTTVINRSGGAVSFNFGGHTQVGDSSIAAGQAGSVVVGPTTTGTSREIFIAASA